MLVCKRTEHVFVSVKKIFFWKNNHEFCIFWFKPVDFSRYILWFGSQHVTKKVSPKLFVGHPKNILSTIAVFSKKEYYNFNYYRFLVVRVSTKKMDRSRKKNIFCLLSFWFLDFANLYTPSTSWQSPGSLYFKKKNNWAFVVHHCSVDFSVLNSFHVFWLF